MNRNRFQELIQRLNQAKISYCLLRDVDLETSQLEELDLLVWPKCRKSFEALARESGFQPWKSDLILKEVYAHFNGQRILLVDVHYALIQNGLVYMKLNGLEPRIGLSSEGYRILSTEDQLLHLFFHSLIGKRHLQGKHLSIVNKIIDQPIDLPYLKRVINDPTIWAVFEAFLENPLSFAEHGNLSHDTSTKICFRLKWHSAGNLWRLFCRKWRSRFLVNRHGIHLAFLGVDGVGKSTLIKGVQEMLARTGPVKFHTVYMGPWGHSRSSLMKWCLRSKFIPPSEDQHLNSRNAVIDPESNSSLLFLSKKLVFGTIKGWVYFASLYFELWYRYLSEIYPMVRRGHIILSDRYIYDARYIHKKRAIRQFKIWRRFICTFFPRPHLIFYLNNSPENIISRKAQLQKEEIQLFQTYYQNALKKLPVQQINTDKTLNELSKEVVDSIMGLYLARR